MIRHASPANNQPMKRYLSIGDLSHLMFEAAPWRFLHCAAEPSVRRPTVVLPLAVAGGRTYGGLQRDHNRIVDGGPISQI